MGSDATPPCTLSIFGVQNLNLMGQDLTYKFYKYNSPALVPIDLTGTSYVLTETGIYIVVFTTVDPYSTQTTYGDPAEAINIRKLTS